MNAVARARSYLARRPPAVAGQGGHAQTFAAACRLVEFGLAAEDAWPLLCEWNARCQPPWAERELRRKLDQAYLRTAPRPEYASGSLRTPHPLSPPSPPPPDRTAGFRRVRLSWDVLPDLDAGTAETVAALAASRGLSAAGVALAVRRGLVRFGRWWRRPA
ncbi:MAG TPA: hypothetical protein PKE47_03270, partial [Verrucomicrobiota bacterium]|nr:hypothetical protein [Verrucomicrobiota bacterium]